MPFLHEFGPDDIFINRLKMAPQYTFMGYSGSLYVNNISGTDGRGSIIGRNTPTGSISVNELNVDRIAISGSEVAMAATGTIEFDTATEANVNGGTIVLTDGLGRTVLFQYICLLMDYPHICLNTRVLIHIIYHLYNQLLQIQYHTLVVR